jgi:hypothetical protein
MHDISINPIPSFIQLNPSKSNNEFDDCKDLKDSAAQSNELTLQVNKIRVRSSCMMKSNFN